MGVDELCKFVNNVLIENLIDKVISDVEDEE